MKKSASFLLCMLGISMAHAETPATNPVTKPAPARATKPAPAAPAAVKPAPAAPAVAAPVVATPAPPPVHLPVALTPEQRRQIELLGNAERLDKANRELLAKNQELQLQNENMVLQNNVLKRDKSSEGVWKGALSVIAGFLMGWYFAGSGRRKSSW